MNAYVFLFAVVLSCTTVQAYKLSTKASHDFEDKTVDSDAKRDLNLSSHLFSEQDIKVLQINTNEPENNSTMNMIDFYYNGDETKMREALEKFFKSIDKDNDGLITGNELQQKFESSKVTNIFGQDNAIPFDEQISLPEWTSISMKSSKRVFKVSPAGCKRADLVLDTCRSKLKEYQEASDFEDLPFAIESSQQLCRLGLSLSNFQLQSCIIAPMFQDPPSLRCDHIESCYRADRLRNANETHLTLASLVVQQGKFDMINWKNAAKYAPPVAIFFTIFSIAYRHFSTEILEERTESLKSDDVVSKVGLSTKEKLNNVGWAGFVTAFFYLAFRGVLVNGVSSSVDVSKSFFGYIKRKILRIA